MKTILSLAGILSLLFTTGCLVGEEGRHEGGRYEHARYEHHEEYVPQPVVVVRPPEVVLRPPEVIVR